MHSALCTVVSFLSCFEIFSLRPILQSSTRKRWSNFGLPVLSLYQPPHKIDGVNQDTLDHFPVRQAFSFFLYQTNPLRNIVFTGSIDLPNCLFVAVHRSQNTSKISSKGKVAFSSSFMGIHAVISCFSSMQDTPTWLCTWFKENLINHAKLFHSHACTVTLAYDNYSLVSTKCSLWCTILCVLAPFCQKWHRQEREIKQYWRIQQSTRLILSLLYRLVCIELK